MCPARSEFNYWPACRCGGYARCFAGNDCLQIDDRQQTGFHQLSFCNWRRDTQYRLAREEDRAFRQSPNISSKVKSFQKFEERFRNMLKQWKGAEIRNIFCQEANVFEKTLGLF